MANNATILAPIPWNPSSYWDGNDGLWNTFILKAGTPEQDFRILPSTAGQETWLPNPDGCNTASPANPGYCGYLRGTLPVNGVNSSGFQDNQSSSWILIGPFTVDSQEASMGYGANALYGFDTVTIGNDSNSLSQNHSVIGSVPDLDFWQGVFGLGAKSINFTNFNEPLAGFMRNLVNNKKIPSVSFGYTAGASYRNKSQASLTLGGYDRNSFDASTSLSYDMNQDNSRPIQVGVQQIIGEFNGAATNLLPTPTYHFIDSTLSHIWLPSDSIQVFVDTFGLIYDNSTDLFIINDTMREKNLKKNLTITFVLGNTIVDGNGPTQSITLPYAAFDLQASYPYYENATNYFPIRKAANESQYTIGRTFLQEAYLITDYERNNFTVAKATFDNRKQHLVAITKPTNQNTTTQHVIHSDTSLPKAVMAGIAIGAIATFALIFGISYLIVRRNKRRAELQPIPLEDPKFNDTDGKPAFQVEKSELPYENGVYEVLVPNMRHELYGMQREIEMEGDLGRAKARPGMSELASTYADHDGVSSQARGSEAVRYELNDTSPENTRKT
ncbi:Hypothetical protein R9X50_00434600 [Acrodontium crateriforme]|uniref:Peptidase A1 domain-containing protein n=1 Tax=Acrodontium crateriforme TaxID=150365 RepID=A0AAQ3RAQ6_9PEZI|nr:Hypothetical protein R9X50_00434600 [Acrodontium crateriforme]